MMYEKFLNSFEETDKISNDEIGGARGSLNDDLFSTIKKLGGKTFNNGLYRVLTFDKVEKISEIIGNAFPKYNDKVVCFSVDWLGRCFAIDKENDSQILFFDVGGNEVLVIPTNIIDFHNVELVEHHNDALASEFYVKWREANKQSIKLSECIGLKTPLFLGGEDIVDNLEEIDLEVYLEICGQLINKTINLSEGTSVGEITLK